MPNKKSGKRSRPRAFIDCPIIETVDVVHYVIGTLSAPPNA